MSKKRASHLAIVEERDDWESGRLGLNVETAKNVGAEEAVNVDGAAALQMISIRLPSSLIRDLKAIAEKQNLIGYQPLMRRILIAFADEHGKAAKRAPEHFDDAWVASKHELGTTTEMVPYALYQSFSQRAGLPALTRLKREDLFLVPRLEPLGGASKKAGVELVTQTATTA